MRRWIKRALTKTIDVKGSRGYYRRIEVEPPKTLVYAVYFSLGMVACLTALEIVHLVILGTWNNEVFTVIAGLVGNITGIFLSQKA